MNSSYEGVIGIRSHGGVPLRDNPDITGSLHELMFCVQGGVEEIHLNDCGLHQGKEKNTIRDLTPQVLSAKTLGLTHLHADHGAAIPDFFRQRDEAKIHTPISIVTSPDSRRLYPPVAFQGAFIHDQEQQYKSRVISETHQSFIAALAQWRESFSGPKVFDRHKRHRSNHKKADFTKNEAVRHAILQESNREMGEQLFLSRISMVFGNKKSPFFDVEIVGLVSALLSQFEDENKRTRNAIFTLLSKKLHDYFTTKRNDLPPSISEYVKASLAHFIDVQNGSDGNAYTHRVNDALSIDMYPTAHVLGSQAFLYRVKLVSGRVVKILMSGDVGRYENNPLGSPIWPKEDIDIMYMEGTYGTQNHPDRVTEISALVDFLNERIAKKGDILIPVFQIQKLQDVCLLLYGLWKEGRLDKNVRFFVSGSLVDILNIEYAKHPAYREALESHLFTSLDTKTRQNIIAGKKSSFSRINIAVGGSLQEQSSAGKMVQYYNGPDDAVVLTGYQFPGTIGHGLSLGMDSGVSMETDICHVFQLKSFSGHAGHDDLVRIVGEVGAKKVVLVHGEPTRLDGLQNILSQKHPDKKIVVAERGVIETID